MMTTRQQQQRHDHSPQVCMLSRPVILTHVPGWKFDAHTGRPIAFVTPGGIVGPKARRFRWDHGSKPPTATEAGTREGWLALATLAEQSSYVGFAITTALACPLLRFA